MRLIKDRNVNIITDEDNHKVILINDIMFKVSVILIGRKLKNT